MLCDLLLDPICHSFPATRSVRPLNQFELLPQLDVSSACAWCALPLPPGRPTPAEPAYCCFGCRFAAEVSRQPGQIGKASWQLFHLAVAIFLTLNVLVFSMVLWSSDLYPGDSALHSDLALSLQGVFRYLCLLLSLPVLWLLLGPLAESAWDQLRAGRPSTDVLLVVGILAAAGYSVVSVIWGGHIYFEVSCMVLVMVTLGRWLEAQGKQQANAVLASLAQLLPDHVCVYRDRQEQTIPLHDLQLGERLRALAGERVAADGCVVEGQAWVDEQWWTGESLPRTKQPGSPVLGGSLNLDGSLWIEVTALPHEGTLQRLKQAVELAQQTKGHYQRLADRVAAWFLPLVMLCAVGTFVWNSIHAGVDQGLLTSLSVVLISCPCALALATPLAIWTALGQASLNQVVFRNSMALERLADVKAVCFDKTGTLTTGHPQWEAWHIAPAEMEADVVSRACQLAAHSRHTLSLALCSAFEDSQTGGESLRDVKTKPGLGLQAVWLPTEETVWLGSAAWMQQAGLQFSATISTAWQLAQTQGSPVVFVGWAGQVRGLCTFRESVRDSAVATIQQLHELSLTTVMLTGDHQAAGKRVAEPLGMEVVAELQPDEKIRELQRLRQSHGAVLMVGDGINDAPALCEADVGAAMGTGADVARNAADLCLLHNQLERLPVAIQLARRTIVIIRQNLFWSFFYNTLGIGLAMSGLLNPIWAAAAMTLSSLLVIGNSLRLQSSSPASKTASPSTLSETAQPLPRGKQSMQEVIP